MSDADRLAQLLHRRLELSVLLDAVHDEVQQEALRAEVCQVESAVDTMLCASGITVELVDAPKHAQHLLSGLSSASTLRKSTHQSTSGAVGGSGASGVVVNRFSTGKSLMEVHRQEAVNQWTPKQIYQMKKFPLR